ncbi:MAG: outer membrane protein assembly factor BamB, partial [Yoonia sp.]
MTGHFRLSAVCAFALLLGCGETDVILPGERFDIRPQQNIVNQSAPIALPGQVANASWTHRNGNASHQMS